MFKYYIIDDLKRHQIFSFISSKPEYFEQLSIDNLKVIYKIFVTNHFLYMLNNFFFLQILLGIDAVQCGLIFGTFYPQNVCDASNQIETDYQRFLFLKGAM